MLTNSKNLIGTMLLIVLAFQAVTDAQLEISNLDCNVNGREIEPYFNVRNTTGLIVNNPGCFIYIWVQDEKYQAWGGLWFWLVEINPHESVFLNDFTAWPITIPREIPVGDHTLEVELFPGGDYAQMTITITEPPPPEPPDVSTLDATSVGQTSATLNGRIDDDGGEISDIQFAYRIANTGSWTYTGWSEDYPTGQTYSYTISDLEAGKTYEFRAEAKNSEGTSSGSKLEFTTEQPDIEFPTVITLEVTGIGQTFATLNGRIDDDGGESCETQFYIADIRTGPLPSTGWSGYYSTDDTFNASISDLAPDTIYEVRAMARNSKGEVLGDVETFTTLPPDVPPLSVTTLDATDVGSTSATLNGILIGDDGMDCQCWFVYRPVGGAQPKQTIKKESLRAGDKFSELIEGLIPGTTYQFNAWASNSVNEMSDGILQFTTEPPVINPPSVLTRAALNVEKTSAELVGRIADDGGEPCQYWFVYRPAGSTQWQETATSGAGGLIGEYYEWDAANPWQVLLMERLDPTINFNWGTDSPDPTVPEDLFMVRWTGQVEAPETATYTFHTQSDDGVRLWVNNVQLIDNWTDHSNDHNSGDIDLTTGQRYDIRLEFYENGGQAVCQLSWSTPSMARAAIPSQYLWSGNESNPVGVTGTNITAPVNNLTPGTTYEFQARAMNSAGTGEGDNQTFTTLPEGFPPVVVTRSATEEEYTSARLSGRIEDDGGLACQTRFQYRRQGSEDCQISFEYCIAGSGNWQDIGQEVVYSEDQEFSASASGLTAGTTYEFRTVASNSAGTIYGNTDSFTTNHAGPGVVEPTVSTLEAAGTGGISATLSGKIDNDGGEACQTHFEYCIAGSDSWQSTGGGRGYSTGQNFSASIHDLAPYTTYDYRAVAENSTGTTFGDTLQFTTGTAEVTGPKVTAPSVSTLSASITGGTSATLHGRIDNDGGEDCLTRFEYSIAGSGSWQYTGVGVGYSTGQNFSASVSGLVPNTTYEFRAVASNQAGMSYGNTEQFTPDPAGPQIIAPSVITLSATDVGETSVTLNGRISNEGGFDWQYTPSSNGRSTWIENVSTGGNFSTMATDLIPGTLYEFRAEARNSAGEHLGLIQPFVTPALPYSPDVVTEPATNVNENSATLNGRISDDGGDACEYSFLYRPVGGNWKDTDWTESALTGDSFSVSADDLIPNTTYEFKALAKNYSGLDEGSILTFTTSDGIIVPPEFVVLHVDDDALNDPGPGSMAISDPDEDGSLIHPFDSIQEAIDMAVDGWKVVVMPGVYTENIDFKAKSIEVSSSEPKGLGIISQTIIDGRSTGSTVSFLNGEDPNSILTGFTITGGLDDLGGGIRCDTSAPTISHCLIVGNQATQNGGGIYCNQSQAYFENCTISDNYARNSGGGIYCNGSPITLLNSIVWANIPDQMYVTTGQKSQSPIVSYCDIDGNWPGTENLSVDPCFVEPGIWMDADNPDKALDSGDMMPVFSRGDYHLLSESGRYDPFSQTWRQDTATSLCIDAGNIESDCTLEPLPNGGRINMGVYGGTLEASRTAIKKPVDVVEIIHGFSLEADPAWITDGNWQFGAPQGKGGRDDGNPDPASGYTGDNVYGVNLAGDYPITVGGPYYLTAGPLNCIGFNNVTLCYARWLNSDTLPYISNTVEVSANGTDWTIIWDPMQTALTDSEWQTIEHDISQVADDQASVYIRWSYAVLNNGAYSCSGWNIDDIELRGIQEQ